MSSIPKTMHGVYLTGHGGLEYLNYRQDIPTPIAQPNQVLIRVRAAGVNNTDINTRIGWYSKNDNDSADTAWTGTPLPLPLIQGADVCGEIVAVGEGVDPSRIGERVIIEPCLKELNGETTDSFFYLGSECNGGFAQYTVVASQHAYAVKSTLSDAELASFPCSYSTAENLLTRSNVAENDRVLITGASGGVGSAAIQLAKARGAHVVAITSASKVEELKALGADEIILRDQDLLQTLGQNNVDVVIDLVGGPTWPQLLDVLKTKGRYAVSGAIAGPMVELDLRTLYLKDISFFGCTMLESEVFGNLVSRIENEQIRAAVAKTFPLQNIHQAQEAFQEKQHVGKIVLLVE